MILDSTCESTLLYSPIYILLKEGMIVCKEYGHSSDKVDVKIEVFFHSSILVGRKTQIDTKFVERHFPSHCTPIPRKWAIPAGNVRGRFKQNCLLGTVIGE